MTQAIYHWLSGFPGLSGGTIHLDFLPPEARNYSVDSVPAEPVLRQYVDGSSRRQMLFTVASREFYGPDAARQEQSLSFFEDLSRWVETQNLRRNLPDLGDGKRSIRVEILSTAYPLAVSPDAMARYQVQMKLTYLQEAIL